MIRPLATCCALLLPLLSLAAAPASTTSPGSSALSALTVRGRMVRLQVPAGFDSVTLEQCTSASKGTWKALSTKLVSKDGDRVDFTLPASVSKKFLRAKGNTSSTLAGDRLNGRTSFGPDPAAQVNGSPLMSGNLLTARTGGIVYSNAVVGVASTNNSTTTDTRSVTESDIWRVAGDRLYFYNEYRGLQVFDLSNPDQPAFLGQMRVQGTGEDMYVLDSGFAALLVRDASLLAPSTGGIPHAFAPNATGAVLISQLAQDGPREVARVPFSGSLAESRMVGNVLYLVSNCWSFSGDDVSGIKVTSIDLSDPANPVVRDTLNLGTWGSVISATDRYLLVARSSDSWSNAIVDVIDISAPDGAIARKASIPVAGMVFDKFKMHVSGDVLTVVSACWNWEADRNARTKTVVQTFSLTDPANPAALGSLELGLGETVRATRFDGDRLYVVTFLSVDPLWIVDLSNPATPTILAELTVPGFSNYIQPLGDRLVAVGRVDGRVALSLFDVADPAHPSQLTQFAIGNGYSWSEANWSEKAFTVDPDNSLIVLPYSSWDPASGALNAVQLVDLKKDELVARGVLTADVLARRSAVIAQDRLLAVSASDLLTVNFADRDNPVVVSDLEIAWRVDRVHTAGDFLLQIGGDLSASGRPSTPTLSVSPANNPDTSLSSLALENLPVVGSTVRDGRLYLLQQKVAPYSDFYARPLTKGNSASSNTPNAPTETLTLSIYDLTQLPQLVLIGQVTADFPSENFASSQFEALWPTTGALAWVRESSQRVGWSWVCGGVGRPIFLTSSVVRTTGGVGIAIPPPAEAPRPKAAVSLSRLATGAILPGCVPFPYIPQTATPEIGIFNVQDPAAPTFVTKLQLRSSNSCDWSSAFTAGGKLLVSSMETTTNGDSALEATIAKASASPARKPQRTKPENKASRHFLRVVSFDTQLRPSISDPINLPGRLLGTVRDGSLLVTTGPRYSGDSTATLDRAVHTSTFDGTNVRILNQLPITNSTWWDRSYILASEALFTSSFNDAGQPRLRSWTLDAEGAFQTGADISLPWTGTLRTVGSLLLNQTWNSEQILDVRNPAKPAELGRLRREYWSSSTSSGDGSPERGFWQAAGDYGVGFLQFNP